MTVTLLWLGGGTRFIPIYKKMGREAFIKWLEKNQQADSKALLKEGKELVKNIKKNGRK